MMFWLSVILLPVLVICQSTPTRADGIEYGDLVLKLEKQTRKARSGLKYLERVEAATEEMKNGKRPDTTFSSWDPLVQNYRDTTGLLADLNSTTGFDSTKYRVPFSSVLRCSEKPQALAAVRGLESELESAIERGGAAKQQLEELLDEADRSMTALRSLIHAYQDVIAVPFYGDIFQLHWLDLETFVRPALGDLRSEAKRTLRKLDSGIDTRTAELENLRGNLALLEGTPCVDE